jgi:cell division protein FtsW
LIGTVSLALLFFFFAVRGIKIAAKAKDEFGRLLAAGISVMIAGQALLNMLVVTSSVPDTGVPLPFISYGGSSLVLNLLCVGILLSVSRFDDPPQRRERRR